MRENRVGAAREDGRHVQPVALEELLGDEGVDAPVDGMETGTGQALVDRMVGEAELTQLIEAKHRVLAGGQARDGLVNRSLCEKPVR